MTHFSWAYEGFWHAASRPTAHEWLFNKRFERRHDAGRDDPEGLSVHAALISAGGR